MSGPDADAQSPAHLVTAADLYSEAAVAGSALAQERGARLYLQLKNFARALQLLRLGHRTVVPTRWHGLLAEALAGHGSLDEAKSLMEQQIARGDFTSVAGVARGFARHGQVEQHTANPDETEKELAIRLNAEGNLRRARELAERGVRGGDIECHLLLGDLRRNSGQRDGVLALWCIALAHGHPDARPRIDRLLAGESAEREHDLFRKYGLDPRGKISGGWSGPISGESEW
jgi:hypothetical protein